MPGSGVEPEQSSAATRKGGGSSSSSPTSTTTTTLLHHIKWPLIRDPPGVGSDYPLLPARVIVTVLSTMATRYLHVHNSHSPVLASSSMALLVSTCLDQRLGQAALCGSIAGMSGGHLTPNLSLAAALGMLTSICYEMLIHIKNLCSGIGGRLGVAAFLVTSVVAKHNGVSIVTRRVRRGALLRKGGRVPGAVGLVDPILVSMIVFHVLGAIATILLRVSSDDFAAANPVRACSVVGLVGSLFLKDPTAALAVHGGSFVGMRLPSQLTHGNSSPGQRLQMPLSLFGSFTGGGAMAGALHASTIRHGYWNRGWGGKAGLCTFAGCWAYCGLGNAVDFIKGKTRN